jgi:hypothetical protein
LRARGKVEQAENGEGHADPAEGKTAVALHNVLLDDPE